MKLKVLLLYKKSTLKHSSFNLGSSNSIIDRTAFVHRFTLTHTKHYEAIKRVEQVLLQNNIYYKKIPRGTAISYKEYNFIITIGGDGTFLEGARNVKKQLILGVNSDPAWSVGKFCYATADNFNVVLSNVLKNQFKIQTLNRFKISLKCQKITANVLNDILICHKNPAAMSRYVLFIKKQSEEQRSSGLWVSTAAGSSGAIFSAGGVVLDVTSQMLQYRARELYQGNKPQQKMKGGIISENSVLKIVSLMKEGYVFVDGSHLRFPFPFGEEISIACSPYPLRMVTG